MSRADIAKSIANDLLDHDALDMQNFGNDTDAALILVQETILCHLRDVVIVQGNIL